MHPRPHPCLWHGDGGRRRASQGISIRLRRKGGPKTNTLRWIIQSRTHFCRANLRRFPILCCRQRWVQMSQCGPKDPHITGLSRTHAAIARIFPESRHMCYVNLKTPESDNPYHCHQFSHFTSCFLACLISHH